MKKSRIIFAAVSVVLFCVILFFGLRWWNSRNSPGRSDLLALMPGDASAIIYADAAALRKELFVAQLLSWAPKPHADPEYAQFLRDTGFDYERDLDRIAIATYKNSGGSAILAVATGRFDKNKIAAYARQHGKVFPLICSKEAFAVPVPDSPYMLSFVFLRDNEIVLTDDDFSGPEKLCTLANPDSRRAEWQLRFDRLSGSPVFAVIQQNAATGDALAAQAPGGLRSPQLSALLNQLQWITLAGIPAGSALRVVVECESSEDANARQLADTLNGVIILAQAGLNDPKTRQQLAPELRQAYLELLNSAEIERIDRNQTKSVRIVFDLTPKFLDAAKTASPVTPAPAVRTKPPVKSTTRN